MKRTIITIFTFLSLILLVSTSWASWTITISRVARTPHYLYWQVVCTSDGDALAATDLLAVSALDPQLLYEMQGAAMLSMAVIPGTGGVIPNTTIDVTWSSSKEELYDHDAFSKDADTPGNDLSEDYPTFPPILKELNLTLNDIGDSGDQVTLVILCWIE